MFRRPDDMEKNSAVQSDRPQTSAGITDSGWQEPSSRGTQHPTSTSEPNGKLGDGQSGSEHRVRASQLGSVQGGVPTAHGLEPHREGPPHFFHEGRVNTNPTARHVDYATHAPRHAVLDVRVYSTPYAFTANHEPLFIQYGTFHGEVAANAAYHVDSGFNHSQQYANDVREQYPGSSYAPPHAFHYRPPPYSGHESYRYGDRPQDHAVHHTEASGYVMARPPIESRPLVETLPSHDPKPAFEQKSPTEHRPSASEKRYGCDRVEAEELPPRESRSVGGPVGASRCNIDYDRVARGDFHGRDDPQPYPSFTPKAAQSFPFRVNQKGPSGRITWTEELHVQFLAAVDEIGLDNAVPMSILNKMNVNGLTREQVASHLQKHRTTLKKLKDDKERELLLTVAAKSVLGKDSAMTKRNLTAEEVLVAVEEDAKSNGDVLPDLSDLPPPTHGKRPSSRAPVKKIIGKRSRVSGGERERDPEMTHKAKKRRYLTKV